jgi:hypothetical protein
MPYSFGMGLLFQPAAGTEYFANQFNRSSGKAVGLFNANTAFGHFSERLSESSYRRGLG